MVIRVTLTPGQFKLGTEEEVKDTTIVIITQGERKDKQPRGNKSQLTKPKQRPVEI